MKSCTAVAWLGLLGSLVSLSPARKLLQPNAPSTKHRETAATLIERVMVDLRYRFKAMVNTKNRACGLPKYSDPSIGLLRPSPLAPQAALDIIRHNAAVADVDEPRDLQLAVTERAPHASRPTRIGIGEDTLVWIRNREAGRVDVQRTPRRAGAGGTDGPTQQRGIRQTATDIAR